MSAPYTLTPQIGTDGRLGLIVLSADETIEAEMRARMPQGDIALFTTRIQSEAEVSTRSLSAMQTRLTGAAQLLPQSIDFDVVGYACTSAASVIGSDVVARLIGAGCTARHVIDPVSALLWACQSRGLSRLALLSPYTQEVNETLRATLARGGVATPAFTSFNEPVETHVARIDPRAILDAALDLARNSDVDGIFMSCTNLRTASILDHVAAQSGLPAFSSNSVLFDRMFQLAGTGV